MHRCSAVFVMLMLAQPLDVAACAMGPAPFNYLIYGQANMVVIAKVIGYSKVSFSPFYGVKKPRSVGLFEFQAVDPRQAPSTMERGRNLLTRNRLMGRFKAYLSNFTYGAPDKWDGPTNVIVALDVGSLPDFTPAVIIAQDPCTSSAIVEDNAENVEKIRYAQDLVRGFIEENLQR